MFFPLNILCREITGIWGKKFKILSLKTQIFQFTKLKFCIYVIGINNNFVSYIGYAEVYIIGYSNDR